MAQGPSTSTVLDTIWNSSRTMNSITGQHLPAKMSLRIWLILDSTGLNLETAGQECMTVSQCLHTPLTKRPLWDYLQQQCGQCKGTLAFELCPPPAEQQCNSQKYAKSFHLIKLIRKIRYQHNILLYKMTIFKMIPALHGHLIPDAYSARSLTVDQEHSAPGGGCFVLRFIYRISP